MATITLNTSDIRMTLKWHFDRTASFVGLLLLWPVLLVVALLIRRKMPGGPVIFRQR